MNMSYCRFRNTALDFAECLATLQEMNDPEELQNELSHEELHMAKRLYGMAKDYVESWELLFPEDNE